MRLFFKLGKYESIYCLKTLKMAIFQQKMAKKWPLMAKMAIFFILILFSYVQWRVMQI